MLHPIMSIVLGVVAGVAAAQAGGDPAPQGESSGLPQLEWFDAAGTTSGQLQEAAPAVAGAIGPDIIVSDIDAVANYGSEGGVFAYSLGILWCNIGDQPASTEWPDGPRPVNVQNIYRFHQGRFEQIGGSWARYHDCALQLDNCATCTPTCGSCCLSLGAGCTDPYTAPRQGTMAHLGPRSAVQAYLGTNPGTYPFPSGPATLRGRIQVQGADLDEGATYYGELHLVAEDDASAGHRHNNASYRLLTLSGAELQTDSESDTVREQPAIMAWPLHDPNAVVTAADVPGEGRFHLGYSARDNGDGTWRYEYAVHNFSSDRAAGSFHVPVHPAVQVTNIGFRDVDAHSGEIWDTTDWTATRDGNEVRWETAPFSVDVNANALHWGTMYNFWFDANAAPAEAGVEIGLFKPGTPGVITAQAAVPAADCSTVVGWCCDQDLNGIRDDGCSWCDCDEACSTVEVSFGDAGGAFGACPPDGFVNLLDLNHVLSCFAGSNTCPALNVDVGGSFGACAADGFCNLFDATHVLSAFAGNNPCACPQGAAPAAFGPAERVAGGVRLAVAAGGDALKPGERVEVRVYAQDPLAELRGYQLHLAASGGTRGRLELVDIEVEPARDPFRGRPDAHIERNIARGQMLSLLAEGSRSTPRRAYLATFTYQASPDAAGTFLIDVLHDAAGDQTFLVARDADAFAVTQVSPAVIRVGSTSTGREP